jgi:hypothetical protein
VKLIGGKLLVWRKPGDGVAIPMTKATKMAVSEHLSSVQIPLSLGINQQGF